MLGTVVWVPDLEPHDRTSREWAGSRLPHGRATVKFLPMTRNRLSVPGRGYLAMTCSGGSSANGSQGPFPVTPTLRGCPADLQDKQAGGRARCVWRDGRR